MAAAWRKSVEQTAAAADNSGANQLMDVHLLRMGITCDPNKRTATLVERGLDFYDAAIVFAGDTITREDVRRNYPERRYQTVGFLAGHMVMVVWTVNDNARHVISMRKCNAREQKAFGKRFAEG